MGCHGDRYIEPPHVLEVEWVANWSKAFLLPSSIRTTHTVLNQPWQKVQLTKSLCFETKGFHELRMLLDLFGFKTMTYFKNKYLTRSISSIRGQLDLILRLKIF